MYRELKEVREWATQVLLGEDIGSRNSFGERPEEGSMPGVFEDTVRSGRRGVGRRESSRERTKRTSGT